MLAGAMLKLYNEANKYKKVCFCWKNRLISFSYIVMPMQRKLTRRQRERKARGQHKKKIRNTILGAAIAIPISLGVAYGIYSQITDESRPTQIAGIQYLLLDEAKKSQDSEFVQRYIDRILSTGRVPFKSTKIIYDPDFEKSIEFWRDQASNYPEKSDKAQQQIEVMYKIQEELYKFREELQKTGNFTSPISPMTSSMGFDGSQTVFVHEIPFYYEATDDLLWALEHERCHREVEPEHTIPIPRDTYDETKRMLDSFYNLLSVEEVRCYSHMFRADQLKRFRVSTRHYNGTLSAFRDVFREMMSYLSGADPASRLFREYVARNFINPYALQPR